MVVPNLTDAASSISELLVSGEYSDMTIQCQGVQFKVHRAIVCTQSPVLATGVKEGFKEAHEPFNLMADELPIVKAMLAYLYNGDYDDQDQGPKETEQLPSELETVSAAEPVLEVQAVEDPAYQERPTSEEEPELVLENPAVQDPYEQYHLGSSKPVDWIDVSPLLFNTKVYIIADKNDVQGLKRLAASKYEDILERAWNPTMFSDAANFLWENTVDSDRLLRNVVIKTAARHIPDLLQHAEFVEILKDHGSLGVDILKSVYGVLLPGETTASKKGKKGKRFLY